MTYKQFKEKWLGKGIDFDGSFGFQCVDVYRMYCKEVLNIPQSPPVKGAKDIWHTYLTKYFDRIENTPTGVPEQGDIIIWDIGTYGHVGIVDSATQSEFTTFEQNWTEMNGSGVTELRNHYYKNVLGWLHFKSIIENMTEEEKRILDFIRERKLTEGQIRQAADWLKDNIVEKQKEEISTLKATISDQCKEMDNKDIEYNTLLSKYNELKGQEPTSINNIKTFDLIKIIIKRFLAH